VKVKSDDARRSARERARKLARAILLLGFVSSCGGAALGGSDGGDASLRADASATDGGSRDEVACPRSDRSADFSLLPKGKPCDPGSPPCALTLYTPCDGGPSWAVPGATNGWTCECKDEVWDCAITSRGLGGGCDEDGGDAAP
jgi:hypothetical protein